jgi:hypothetical protein
MQSALSMVNGCAVVPLALTGEALLPRGDVIEAMFAKLNDDVHPSRPVP